MNAMLIRCAHVVTGAAFRRRLDRASLFVGAFAAASVALSCANGLWLVR